METRGIAIVGLIFILAVSGYFNWKSYSTFSTLERDKTEIIATENLFKKKQECEQYRSDIHARLEALNLYNSDTNYQSMNFLEKLFYSPKMNTCLYVARQWGLVNNTLTYETLTLEDALTGEIITTSMREVGSEDYLEREKGFEDYVKDYE